MTSEISGRIICATNLGLVAVDLTVPDDKIGKNIQFEISDGRGETVIVPEDALNKKSESAGNVTCVQLASIAGAKDAKVTLSAIQDARRSTLDTAEIATLAGSIDFIDDAGDVCGWCVSDSSAEPALELVIDGVPVASTLADRFYLRFSTAEAPSFVGFKIRLPSATFRKLGRRSVITLRGYPDGCPLFSAKVEELRIWRKASSAAIPVDVISQPPFSSIYDAESVERFYRVLGPDRFVDMVYAYILERPSDIGGRTTFATRLRAGHETPRSLMHMMYCSEERQRKGAFVGPVAGDATYPFDIGEISRSKAVDPYGDAVSDIEDLLKDVAPFKGEGRLADISRAHDYLTAENERLTRKNQQLGEIQQRLQKQIVTGTLHAGGSGPTGRRTLRLGNIEIIWGGPEFQLRFRSRSAGRLLAAADRKRDERNWTEASLLYHEVLQRQPDNAPIWVQYGHALKESGRLADAEVAYTRAIAIDGTSADAHLQRGHALKLQERYDEAVAEYKTAATLDPSNPHAGPEMRGLQRTLGVDDN